MKFKIKLIREKDKVKEEKFEIVKAESAAEAYCVAMRMSSHSEGWSPFEWELISENV